MLGKTAAVALLTGAALLAIPAAVSAQTAEEDSVKNRARPEFDPIGIELDEFLGTFGLVSARTIEQKSSPLSSFTVFPTFGVTADYDSNIFLTETNAVSDKKVVYAPSLGISSDWANHSLTFSANASIGRHVDNTREDFEDFQLQTGGRIDVDEYRFVTGTAGVNRKHESRGEEDDPGQGFAPTVLYNWFADTTAEYLADAFLVRLTFNYDFDDYLNSTGRNNDVQDVRTYDFSARFGYEFTPGTTVFVEPNGDLRRFVQKRDDIGLLQDNGSVGTLVGVTFDATGVTFLEFGVGVTHRAYEEPSFKSQTNLDFSGKLIWNPTDLTTVTGAIGRNTAESATQGESGVLSTSYSLGIDHEFLDNVILSAGLTHVRGDNQQTSRIDMDYSATFGVSYLVNANLSAQLTLAQARRESNLIGESYENFIATIGLTGKL